MLIMPTYQLSARRILTPGCQVRVAGERGLYLYRCASESKLGRWSIHLYGQDGFRAVRPERITRIVRR